ncbi:hypothetical protein IQ264_28075 [Phormidium sp. LEGE 05292]|uniref:hypothetical protein n=1 Tax=[Phormidium] sp. LEGE 05292 TaxID=767427 RepID=UPI00187F26BC|nr:hypothetical protein [Phormidium sp. LEGE 05292]MBE9229267.1 hypothetical protein [Phormidium sp. LEGE 05292]
MSVSQNRRQQIEAQLAKHGITATDKAVNAVVELMKADQRATVASASRKYAQSQQGQSTNQTTEQTATAPTGDKLQDNLAALSDILGDRIAEGILSKAVDKAVDRIQNGNWTVNSKSKSKLENLKEALDCEFEIVSENFLSLPTNGLSNALLLSSSDETSKAEILVQ